MTPEGTGNGPPPRANPDLLGHKAAERALRRLFETGRMPHAVLMTGPRGIGKATLAYRLARFVLAHGATGSEGTPAVEDESTLAVPADCGVFRRIASGGHADLLTVERAYDPRRRRLRSEIVVDDAREIAAFLRRTPAEGGWRVVVVDSADEMNRSAANALLKILEEPPRRALLLLVAHSPGRLLPTIRSRCRRFPLQPLPPPIVSRLLDTYRPGLPQAKSTALVALTDGSIGRALELAEAGGVELYHEILALLSREQGVDPAALHALADRVSRGEADSAYRAVEELLSHVLGEIAVQAAGGNSGRKPRPEADRVLHRLGAAASAVRWAELRAQVAAIFARGEALNLDRKQTILGAFFAVERIARRSAPRR
ncbi:MAG: DNA polymerase III subunit delta' [Alphaproteobacteria bacterium]